MLRNLLRPFILFVVFWLAPTAPAHSAVPEVLVTIKPIHSLVSGLLQDIAEPGLLIEGYQSPHTFQLRPGDLDKIHRAEILIWIGPGIETPLQRIIGQQTDKTVIRLGDDIQVADDHHQADSDHHQADSDHHHLHEDQHRWMDPYLVLEDMQRVSRILSRHLPAHVSTIERNLARLTERMQRLDQDIRARFAGPQTIPALLYHDAWGRFLERYELEMHGIVNPHAHAQPGARHLHDIEEIIKRRQTRCLMVEPQFRSSQVETLQARYELQIIKLDPLGADLPATADAYFTLMRNMTEALAGCR